MVKFYDAQLCCSCEEIVDIAASSCPSCLDTAFFPLLSIIQPACALPEKVEKGIEVVRCLSETWRLPRR